MAASLKTSLLQPLRSTTSSAIKPAFSSTQRAPPTRAAAASAAAPSCATATSLPTAATTLYDVLGVTRGASQAEIKTSYRRLARLYHPDSNQKEASAEQFLRIHAAYAALADPATRARYDIQLCSVRNPRPVPKAPVSSWRMRPRTWETDQCW